MNFKAATQQVLSSVPHMMFVFLSIALAAASHAGAAETELYSESGADRFGRNIAPGWVDRIAKRPNPNWIVDSIFKLRFVRKREIGLITYDGYLQDGTSARVMTDAIVRAKFVLPVDPTCHCGVAVRVQDARNYYAARITGDGRFQWLVVADGVETVVSETVTNPLWFANNLIHFEVRAVGEVFTAEILSDLLRRKPLCV